jgi:hypothetical protein
VAKYGPSSVTITLDDSGGTARDLSQYIISIGGIKINAGMVDSTGFGDSWTESLSTGKRFMDGRCSDRGVSISLGVVGVQGDPCGLSRERHRSQSYCSRRWNCKG